MKLVSNENSSPNNNIVIKELLEFLNFKNIYVFIITIGCN